jgi:hypothetical protein
VTDVHVAVGIAVVALNALAAAWGGISWLRRDPSVVFWYLLRAAQAAVVAEVVLGAVLLAQGHDAPDGLHLFYGLAPLLVTLISEGMRVGAAQVELADVEDVDALDRREQVLVARRVVMREMGVMTVGTLMILTLSLRAAQIF